MLNNIYVSIPILVDIVASCSLVSAKFSSRLFREIIPYDLTKAVSAVRKISTAFAYSPWSSYTRAALANRVEYAGCAGP